MKTLLFLLLPLPLFAQSREEKVRDDKERTEKAAYWIFNDFDAAKAQAKKENKPIVAVLRCVPCEECVKLDDEVIDADPAMRKLLDQFVRVRLISTNGLDLATFQFDTDQSWAAFFLNADGTLYGRFGTRSHRTNWVGDVSLKGFQHASSMAMVLHQNGRAGDLTLAGKRGPKPEVATPEKYPSLAVKYKPQIDFNAKVAVSCIHCHQIGDAKRELVLSRREKFPEELLFPFPHPKSLGLVIHPHDGRTITAVEAGSVAAKSGFVVGRHILSMNKQPIGSIADVQWVLEQTPAAGGTIDVDIGGDAFLMGQTLKLTLPPGWRRANDISWRASTWGLRRAALGGLKLDELDAAERKKLNLADGKTGLLVAHVGAFAPHNLAQKAGLRKGDIVLAIDGNDTIRRETDAIAYVLLDRTKQGGLSVKYHRDGVDATATIELAK